MCVLHSVDGHCVSILHCREALCGNCTMWRGIVCVLHCVVRYCVCTAQFRMALCAYCAV